jgi:hypothetical protein
MAKKQLVSPSQKEYMERHLAEVEKRRSRPIGAADIEHILANMQSEDEATRANAVRQICPCRMPWEVFDRLRKAAKPLQKDPSPPVRANALHIEEDAREVASLEALSERLQEREEAADAAPRLNRRGRQRRKRWPVEND